MLQVNIALQHTHCVFHLNMNHQGLNSNTRLLTSVNEVPFITAGVVGNPISPSARLLASSIGVSISGILRLLRLSSLRENSSLVCVAETLKK